MSLKLVPTLGAPDVMPSSTPMGTTQECVRLAGSARSAIMRSGTLFSSGVNAVAFALSVSGPACCSRSNLMTWALLAVGLLMFSFRPSKAVLLQSTSPSRRLSGWTSLVRREATHQQPPRQPTLSTSANTWTPRPSVVPRTFTSYLWWWKRLEPGPLRLPRPWVASAVPLLSMALGLEARPCCKKPVWWYDPGVPALRCGGEPSCSHSWPSSWPSACYWWCSEWEAPSCTVLSPGHCVTAHKTEHTEPGTEHPVLLPIDAFWSQCLKRCSLGFLPHDSDFWKLEISVALFGVHDLCCPRQPLWARARGIVEPAVAIFSLSSQQ